MICKVCGAENEQDNAFCMNCGARLEPEETAETATEAVDAAEAPSEQEPEQETVPPEQPDTPPETAPIVPPPLHSAPTVPPVAPPAPQHDPVPPPQPVFQPQAPKGPPETRRTLRLPSAPDMPGLSFFDGTTGQYFGYLLLFGFLNAVIMAVPAVLAFLLAGTAISKVGAGFWEAEFVLEYGDLDTLKIVLLAVVAFFAILLVLLVTSWMYTVLIRWMSHHTIVNDHRLVFIGKSFDLFKRLLLYWLLCVITLGIFSIWVPVKLLRWKAAHTRFAT